MQLQKNHNKHLLATDQEAIVALCTPRGSGALALIRLSGVNAFEVANSCARLSSNLSLLQAPSHTIHHGYVIDPADESTVDEVVFLLMRGPKTFTGQDTVEITCHNNHFIIERIIELTIQQGARAARGGEFTKRAFLNGKVDLLQAESINELIHAQTEYALRKSMATLHGSLSQSLQQLEAQLTNLLGYVEASFEFLDEEQRDLNFDQAIIQRTQTIFDFIVQLRKHFSSQKQIKEGVRVALLGMVNVGKSTLFNALARQERAIVTDIAGTTRDSIETGLYKNGNFWLLIDTAGIRQTVDVVEKMGIERSFAQAAAADVILVVVDATIPLTTEHAAHYALFINDYRDKVLVVINKIDAASDVALPPELLQGVPVISVSAKLGRGIADLEATIEHKIQKLFAQLNAPFLINRRQFKLLTEIQSKLEIIANSYSDGIHYELIAYQLKDLLESVSELTGRNVTEQVLDTVFNEFCVGK